MSTLYVDNLQPNLGSRVMAAGHVVNVVQGTLTAQTESSAATGTEVDINLYTPVITPSAQTNKQKINVASLSLRVRDSSTYAALVLERKIGTGSWTKLVAFAEYFGEGPQEGYPTLDYLDTPNTTDTIQYRIIGKRIGGTANVAYMHNSTASHFSGISSVATITAMEIAQ